MYQRNPEVNISILTFNRVGYLKLLMDTVFSQSYQNYRVTIFDNGSTDGTKDYVANVLAPMGIKCCRSEENRGALWNFERAYQDLDGDLRIILHDDDLLSPEYLQLIVNTFQTLDVQYVGVSTNCKIINSSGLVTSSNALGLARSRTFKIGEYIRYYLLTGRNLVIWPSLCIRTEALKGLKLFPEAGPAADVDFNRQLNRKGMIHICSETPFYYRRHSAQDSQAGRPYAIESKLGLFYLLKLRYFHLACVFLAIIQVRKLRFYASRIRTEF